MSCKRVLECVDVESMLVHRNAYHVQAVIAKDEQRQKVRRLFDKNRVARLREACADKIERL